MVRNESNSIEEWVNHYLVRGVSHFFIIDDNSDDGCYEILKKYENLGYLKVIRPKIPQIPNRQNIAYNKFIKPLIDNFDWVAILDADEFLWDSGGFSLPDYLSNIPNEISIIKVQMSDFGDNGFVSQPDDIVNSFTRRAEDIKNPTKTHFKSVCRVSDLLSIDFHVSNVSGDTMVDECRLKLNHYKLQSLDRWKNLVVPRGSANYTMRGRSRHTEQYFEANTKRMNAVEDLGLIIQNNQIK
jgi:glycosyltransferase involved in cell wall biosynthesis